LLLGENLLDGAPEDKVSRAEFVCALGKLFMYSEKITDKGKFNDVPWEHDAAAEIYNARALGYIDAAENFNPDAQLTSDAAIKLVICYAGYKTLAEQKGGFPSGYLKIAVENDFLDGLNNNFYKEPLNVKSAKILLYNAMLADYVGVRSVSEYVTRYEKYPDNLAAIHEIFQVTGVLNASSYTSLFGDVREHKDNLIEIEGVEYRSEEDYDDLLGYRCTAFYKTDGGNRTVLSVIPDKNEEYEFGLDEFIGLENGKIKLYDREQKKNVTISVDDSGKTLVYNGCGENFNISYFSGDGTVKVIDNDRDGKGEVIIINKYRYLKVANISTADGEIGFADNYGANALVLDEDVVYTMENQDCEKLTIYDIKPGDFLAVRESSDGRVVKVVVCDAVITGKLSFIDREESIIGINEESYRVSKEFTENEFPKITLGEVYDFVQGPDGTVIACEQPASGFMYAYLVKYSDNANGFAKREVKLFTQMGEMLVLSGSKKFKVDGEKIDEKLFFEKLSDRKYPCPSLVKIKFSSDGSLTHIDFPESYTDTTDRESMSEQNKLLRYTFPDKTSFRYRSGANSCMPYFNLKDTVIFKIPLDIEDDENFSVVGSSYLSDNTDYKFDTYDINEAGSAGAIVWRINPKDGNFSYHHNSYIVEKIRRGQDTEGNDVQIVHCWSMGKYYMYYLDDDVVVKKDSGKALCGGDIIRAKVNSKNSITALVVDFDASSGIPVKNSYAGEIFELSNVSLTYQFGKLHSISDGYAYISNAKDAFGDYDYGFYNLKNCYINTKNIVKYDSELKELRPVTQDELKTYVSHGNENHYAVIRQNIFNINSMYIYE